MRWSSPRRKTGAFTLLEVLITLAVLLAILVTLIEFMSSTDKAWKSAAADPYAEAGNAFETISQTLASATLEPYFDYADRTGYFQQASSVNFAPDHLARRSDLDFACGPTNGTTGLLQNSGRVTTGSAVFFITPQGYTQSCKHQGMGRLLNACGYFVEFGDMDQAPAFALTSTHSWRWRLKQVVQPAESLQVGASNLSTPWIQTLTQGTASPPILAENIVTLLVLPERVSTDSGATLAPDFRYDSRDAGNALTRHQLPARVRLVLVAMDAASAQLLENRNGSNPPQLVPATLFQKSEQLNADLTALDTALTAQNIKHRIFQREILLSSAAWSNVTSP